MERGKVVLGKFTVFRKLLLAQRLQTVHAKYSRFRSDKHFSMVTLLCYYIPIITILLVCYTSVSVCMMHLHMQGVERGSRFIL